MSYKSRKKLDESVKAIEGIMDMNAPDAYKILLGMAQVCACIVTAGEAIEAKLEELKPVEPVG